MAVLTFSLLPSVVGAEEAGPLLSSFQLGEAPTVEKAASVAAVVDRNASVTLGKEDLQDPEKVRRTATDMFEAYMTEARFRPIEKVIARAKFKQVTAWTVPFLQSHAESITMSLRTEEALGKNRLVSHSAFDYNGHKVEILRFRDGNDSVSMMKIDGKFELDKETGEERVWLTKGKEEFGEFVKWFDSRLGKPGQRQ
jgi:hypothetical protein